MLCWQPCSEPRCLRPRYPRPVHQAGLERCPYPPTAGSLARCQVCQSSMLQRRAVTASQQPATATACRPAQITLLFHCNTPARHPAPSAVRLHAPAQASDRSPLRSAAVSPPAHHAQATAARSGQDPSAPSARSTPPTQQQPPPAGQAVSAPLQGAGALLHSARLSFHAARRRLPIHRKAVLSTPAASSPRCRCMSSRLARKGISTPCNWRAGARWWQAPLP